MAKGYSQEQLERYARMNAYRSQILEHHTTLGGVAACWKRRGYLIDGGIHFLMSHKPGQPSESPSGMLIYF